MSDFELLSNEEMVELLLSGDAKEWNSHMFHLREYIVKSLNAYKEDIPPPDGAIFDAIKLCKDQFPGFGSKLRDRVGGTWDASFDREGNLRNPEAFFTREQKELLLIIYQNLVIVKLKSPLVDLTNFCVPIGISFYGCDQAEQFIAASSVTGPLSFNQCGFSKYDIRNWFGKLYLGIIGSESKDQSKIEQIYIEHQNSPGFVFAVVNAGSIGSLEVLVNGETKEFSVVGSQEIESVKLHIQSAFSMDFVNCDLSNLQFHQSKAEVCFFNDVSFSKKTKFEDCKFRKLHVDRFALECLEDYGGLSIEQRLSADIRDDAATLRFEYSGLNRWIHIIALGVFLAPYAFFLYARVLESRFFIEDNDETITLFTSLINYVWSGGVDWKNGEQFHLSFLVFIFGVLYNLLRFILLRKTISIEENERLNNLPSNFSFENLVLSGKRISSHPSHGRQILTHGKDRSFSEFKQYLKTWRFLFNSAKISFWIYVVGTVLNLFHFLGRDVPI